MNASAPVTSIYLDMIKARTILAYKPDGLTILDRLQSRVFFADVTAPHDEVYVETEKRR